MKNAPLFPVVILAGGLATRLRPLTEKIPKALIDINSEPFIFHQLRLLKQQGIKEIVLCLGYLGEQVIEILAKSPITGITIQYSFDGPTLLGTAGAIKKSLPLLNNKSFFVLYGDSYLPCNFSAVQQTYMNSEKAALMTIYHNENQWDSSNVVFDGKHILVYDKIHKIPEMHYIDYGLGIFNQSAFANVPVDSAYDLATLYQNLLTQHQLTAHLIKERFYEIGSLTGIKELSHYLYLTQSANKN